MVVGDWIRRVTRRKGRDSDASTNYGQTRRFVVVDTTPKTVRVREIRRWGLDDLAVKRVREDGTFKLGPWQVAYLENPEKVAAGAYAQDFPW